MGSEFNMKLKKKNEAIELRKQGLSMKEISKELQVSQSSVSLWVRDIVLTPEQILKLSANNPIINRQLSGAKTKSNNARLKRLEFQLKGKNKAKEGNLLHQAGCLLYWAEGTKSKNSCRFTNSDINMILLYMKFLRECFQLENKFISLTINCYTTNGISKEDIEKYWLDKLGLDKSSLRKGVENLRPRSVTNQIRHNKLMYGIISINVNSTEIVQHIYGAIQEYAGFDNNYMLK